MLGWSKAGGGFGLTAKALQVRFGGPLAQANHFERDGAVEAFLPRAINHALAAATDLFQQFVITEVSKHALSARAGAFSRLRRGFAGGRTRSSSSESRSTIVRSTVHP